MKIRYFLRTMYRLISFSLLLASINAYSQSAQELYAAQKYQEALNTLQTQPLDQANYFYNLGTTHYRLGHTGLAFAYLEKANRLQPHDSDIQHNQSVIRAALGKTLENTQLDPTSTWVEQLTDSISINEIRITLGLLGLAVLTFLTYSYKKNRRLRYLITQPTGLINLCGCCLILALLWMQQIAKTSAPAICIGPGVVWSGPGTHYIELGQLAAGVKIRLLETTTLQNNSERWSQIRFSSDRIGWIQHSRLLEL